MFSTRPLFLALVAACVAASVSTTTFAHPLPVPHTDEVPTTYNAQAIDLLSATEFAQPPPEAPATRNLRAQHNGEDHSGQTPGVAQQNGAIMAPGGQAAAPAAPAPAAGGGGVKNPGGILGPLYQMFPQLLAPLAMASDTIHNTNAAISGVQHTPDGIFQA